MRHRQDVLYAPSALDLQRLQSLYDQGLTLEAFHQASALAPLRDWAGAPGCNLAARLAANLGCGRLSARLAVRAWRADRTHPLAQMEYGLELLQFRGPLELWRSSQHWPQRPLLDPVWEAEVLTLQVIAAGMLRDFGTAEKLQQQAEALAPQSAWVRLQRASLLEHQEQVEAALDLARAACALHPWPYYRPGVQKVAHLLQLLDRDQEALELLSGANIALQNGPLAAQFYSLLADLRQWAEAAAALERYAQLMPVAEAPARKWLQAQQARVACYLGQREVARSHAQALDDPFHQQFAERLAQPAPAQECVRWDVPFVRQHFKTCAPATLASLAQYWQMPADHLALAAEVCYDGTPSWKQRDWAEKHGWLVREFRVTEEVAQALLGRGVPFALMTSEANSGHMQAVIGFHQTRAVLYLRDPGRPYCLEVPTAEFLERYRPAGPRGMLFLPVAEGARLADLILPDAELYDAWHAISLALGQHKRPAAKAALAQLETNWPEHAVTWESRLTLALYDDDLREQLRCLDALLAQFPNHAARQLHRLACMREHSREERIEWLEGVCQSKEADPALLVPLARDLMREAPRQAVAARCLRRALRSRPLDSSAMVALADLRWATGQYAEAVELYWFAATVEGYRENLYRSWFVACQQVRQTATALAHLEDRFQRFGALSGQPAITLAWALNELEQPSRAREVLTHALELRPEDGDLLQQAAIFHARHRAYETAEQLLASAYGKIRENEWLRAMAEMAELRLDATKAMGYARQLLKLEPLATDAHSGVASALNRLEGPATALDHLQQAVAAHPHHCGLRRLHIQWAASLSPEAEVEAARAFLEISPRDAWARRALAWALTRQGQWDAALPEAEQALEWEPRAAASESLLGAIHERRGDLVLAREHFRKAVTLDVDNSAAVDGLLRLAGDDAARREELRFVEQELVRQVVQGDGLLAYMEAARPVLDHEALLASLRQAHQERPDLWHTWSALAHQLMHLGQTEEALAIARQSTERFPHLPRLWLDLAEAHRLRQDGPAEIAAAEQAVLINPSWGHSTVVLADALERHRTLNDALAAYERALEHAPQDAALWFKSAGLLWRLRRPEVALDHVEESLRLAPGMDWAWEQLVTWAVEFGQPKRPEKFARQWVKNLPGDARGWEKLARVMDPAAPLSERLAAVNRALELNPRGHDAWDLKAELLANALQFDAAVAACNQGITQGEAQAYLLRGRLAWIEARRGKLPEAIAQMRAVLESNRGYFWGWQLLAVWLAEQQDYPAAEAAISELLRLRPQHSWAQSQLALLRLKQGDRAGAENVFRAVLASNSDDQQAAENLFDLQLENQNWDGAEQTLQHLQTHIPGARTLACEVLLRAARQQPEAALATFSALCAQVDPDPWPVAAAAAALEKAGQRRAALRVLREAIQEFDCNPHAGATAIQMLCARRHTWRAWLLFGDIRPDSARAQAALAIADGMTKRSDDWTLLLGLRFYRQEFFQNDRAWRQMAFALVQCHCMGTALKWVAGWRSRTRLDPWLLHAIAYLYRRHGQYQAANEVMDYAVKQWGFESPDGPNFRPYLAVEAALEGNLSKAEEHVAHSPMRRDTPYQNKLVVIATQLTVFLRCPLADRSRKFRELRREIDVMVPSLITESEPDIKHTMRRVRQVVVENGGGLSARIWFFWKFHWQWSFLVLLTLPFSALTLVAGIMLFFLVINILGKRYE